MTRSKIKIALCASLAMLAIVLFLERKHLRLLIKRISGVSASADLRLVDDQVARLGPTTHRRLAAIFRSKGLEYPPDKLALVGLKDIGQLQIYVANGGRPYTFVDSYTINDTKSKNVVNSNKTNDQVPEGIYYLSSLEPHARWHLGLRVTYPNEFDLLHLKGAHTVPGSLLLIHGGSPALGTLTVDDQASEDLFLLAYDTKDRNIPVVVTPIDLRISRSIAPNPHDPSWEVELYRDIRKALANYPLAEQK